MVESHVWVLWQAGTWKMFVTAPVAFKRWLTIWVQAAWGFRFF